MGNKEFILTVIEALFDRIHTIEERGLDQSYYNGAEDMAAALIMVVSGFSVFDIKQHMDVQRWTDSPQDVIRRLRAAGIE